MTDGEGSQPSPTSVMSEKSFVGSVRWDPEGKVRGKLLRSVWATESLVGCVIMCDYLKHENQCEIWVSLCPVTMDNPFPLFRDQVLKLGSKGQAPKGFIVKLGPELSST